MGTKDLTTGKSTTVIELLPADQLDALAVRIRTEHQAAKIAARKTLEHAIQAGALLLEAKALVGHGRWGDWLHDHCDVSERTAQGYMRLARNRAALASKAQTTADLTIDEALRALAKPNDPHPDRAIVLSVAEYLPADGMLRLGMLHDRSMSEVFGVFESADYPGYFRVVITDFAHVTWTRRPTRAEGVKPWIEYAMRNPAMWDRIEWQDEALGFCRFLRCNVSRSGIPERDEA